jgi:preprotein translocase subunit SecD
MIVFVVLAAVFGFGPGIWSSSVQAAVHFEMRLAEDSPAPGLKAAPVAGTSRTIYLHDEVLITNSDIVQAVVTPGRTPRTFNVEVLFSAASAEKINRATAQHIGRPIALLIDDSVVNAPTIRSAIGDSAVINGDFTEAEAQMMAAGIERR